MGRNQHSKDRLFITATEWAVEYGGKKRARQTGQRTLPFDSCALSLQPFETPVCTSDGIIFEILHIMQFLKKHKKNPVNSQPLKFKDLLHLTMDKNQQGQWRCPVTFKTFTDKSKVVAIRTSGHVYAWEAVNDLNIKAKNWRDLMTDAPFTRQDIIKLQDPDDAELCSRRDISNFTLLKELREEEAQLQGSQAAARNIRATPSQTALFKEIEAARKQHREEQRADVQARAAAEQEALESIPDLRAIRLLRPTIEDVRPGGAENNAAAVGSFTSSGVDVATKLQAREATVEEIREARRKCCRVLGKKGYVQLQTSHGNLNLEIYSHMVPRTAENFLGLCAKGYYNGTKFHRNIPGFMLQGGDPTSTGRGGESLWGGTFGDEFDSRLVHNDRGVLSMANAGPGTNRSQFFLAYKDCRHLDNKHTVFGKVVGGAATLDRLEAEPTGKKDVPLKDITIITTTVFADPIAEATQVLEGLIRERQEARQAALAKRSAATGGQQATMPASHLARQAEEQADRRKGWFSDSTPGASSSSSSSSSSGVGKYLGGAAKNTTLSLPPSASSSSSSSAVAAAVEEAPVEPVAKRAKVVTKTKFSDFSAW